MSFLNGRRCGLILSAFLLATPVFAHGYKAGTLEISHPWSRETPPSATTGVGYLSIHNSGTDADRLVSIETAAAQKVEVHESTVENGVAKMRPVGPLEIPAGGDVTLKPGGLHLMMVGLKEGLAEGERVPATLVFEKAGRVDIEFEVDSMGAKGPDAKADVGHQHH
jgi:periplasmic copper chaperone A